MAKEPWPLCLVACWANRKFSRTASLPAAIHCGKKSPQKLLRSATSAIATEIHCFR